MTQKKLTSNGWIETTTKGIIVILKDQTPINTAGGWVDFCRRHPSLNTRGRNHCERCDVEWQNIDPLENTYFLQTSKGNKIVCQACFAQITGPEIKSRINKNESC